MLQLYIRTTAQIFLACQDQFFKVISEHKNSCQDLQKLLKFMVIHQQFKKNLVEHSLMFFTIVPV